jgi:hypothetical protein
MEADFRRFLPKFHGVQDRQIQAGLNVAMQVFS